MYINPVVSESEPQVQFLVSLQPFVHSDQSLLNCVPLELLQDTDLSLLTIALHQSLHYPDYLSPTWDKDTQRAVVWTRLCEHWKLVNRSLAKINKRYLTLHQEQQQTQVESSHELLSCDICSSIPPLPRTFSFSFPHFNTFPSQFST